MTTTVFADPRWLQPQTSTPLHQPPGDLTKSIQERFEDFDRLNPWVYRRLVEMTYQWIARRPDRRVGIDLFFAVLRWEYAMATNDPNGDFRLNDHYRSRYARKIMGENPGLGDVFETRKLKTP